MNSLSVGVVVVVVVVGATLGVGQAAAEHETEYTCPWVYGQLVPRVPVAAWVTV
jgi:hypothetical protein